jgi:hypothetical protein
MINSSLFGFDICFDCWFNMQKVGAAALVVFLQKLVILLQNPLKRALLRE